MIVNRFVAAAQQVIEAEVGGPVQRGPLEVRDNPYASEEVTAVIGISGAVAGSMYVSMSEETALATVSTMLGQKMTVFDELAQSGIAELANVIAGTAGVAIAEGGDMMQISPPLLLCGAGARLSSVQIQRIVVPLTTAVGRVAIHVSLRGI